MEGQPTISYPPDLPISARREEIVETLRRSQVVIVAGETGSGKTTQLPKMCLEAGLAQRGKVGCTQPRRVAAMSISRRVAEELKVTWGREVGCKMRFNDDTSRDTQIKFMTDGILLAEIQSDPLLRSYSALIIDEAHERSLNIDFLLGYLQGLLKRRTDLKLIITSATIDTEAFSKAFGNAPIIEVSGRLYPVDLRYQPIGAESESGEDISFIEAAVRATEDALIESDSGDVLIFMPTERDIRETRDLLEGALGSGIEVLGLYGRLPAGEQQRIFAPGGKRRVVVATNVAETSLTIPRIRYVIDSGLARMSRYSPRTRTKRLPIEAISQSSANQRAGRAGRVRDGICIRLFSEEDYTKRPRFTQPEIQRANLAEVILRMKAFHLGEVETFPFLNPPQQQAIRAGYLLLEELGALSEEHNLTPTGRELARLPIDPTLGRMLLQARRENALPEILVIAAALSVPDPRERPEEAKEAAATAHRAFANPESDFLTLLNIWQAAPESSTSRNALRRFCKENFLSMIRMREWRDIYLQLADSLHLNVAKRKAAQHGSATYDAIHRSILTGLLGHIAQRQEKNVYKASGNRLVTIFPGSGLYERRDKKKSAPRPGQPAEKSKQPEWMMSGEIVETSQLFARSNARIAPEWVVDLGVHLCRFSYSEPAWSAKAGRVLAWERVLIHGLEILRRKVDYGRINAAEATEIFIRGALVAEDVHIPQRFFGENHKLREKLESALTRVRSGRVHDLDEAFYRFYAARIENVSSKHDLNALIKERITRNPDFLVAKESDIIDAAGLEYDRAMFPEQVKIGTSVLPLTYAYTPGEEKDGVTVRVPIPLADKLTPAEVQWMVPGLRREQIETLLRGLPKALRKQLMPIEPKIAETVEKFQPDSEHFLESLATFLTRTYRIEVKPEDWRPDALPEHLRPRVEVVDKHNRTVAASRDLEVVRTHAEKKGASSGAWAAAVRKWEQKGLVNWTFDDLPESVVIEEVGGAPLLAYPGLVARDKHVDIQLFRVRREAEAASVAGIRRLAENAAAKDITWLLKELRIVFADGPTRDRKPTTFGNALSAFSAFSAQVQKPKSTPTAPDQITMDGLRAAALEHILSQLFRLEPALPLTKSRFDAMVEQAHRELPLLVRRVGDQAKAILNLRSKVLQSSKRYTGLEADVQRLVPADFLLHTPSGQLQHIPRYLRAIEVRAERASLSPAKDAEKAKQLAPMSGWDSKVAEEKRETVRWMMEELRVSIFAQELGTAQPVSIARIRAVAGLE